MSAVTVLAEATMRSAIKQVISRELEVDASEMAEALREVCKTNLSRVMSEWKDAIDARLSEGWLRQLINTQANELANEALQSLGH